MTLLDFVKTFQVDARRTMEARASNGVINVYVRGFTGVAKDNASVLHHLDDYDFKSGMLMPIFSESLADRLAMAKKVGATLDY